MNDVSRTSGANPRQPHSQPMDLSTDQAVEHAALAGAAAIQKLVEERNELRTRLVAQEQETAAYRALNNELRRQLLVVHQNYVEVAKGIVSDLERFDATLRETAQEAHSAMETQMPWQNAASTAQARAQDVAAAMNGTNPTDRRK
ncbi:hypothetical protein [Methyloceanibacter sp.]|uniref:hypothetical protein n=1 Tax=Methyloceanibacter sp. TaxID=1965321 RepID=UPI0025FF95FC|nr:hypothetical protein [Methyloceanibacter sp.]MCC0058926.1 hypothetical protein [Hyphomicrobiaceae bacterium]